MERRITVNVVKCSDYGEIGPSIYDMEQTAWLIDPRRRQIGFVAPGTEEHKKLIR